MGTAVVTKNLTKVFGDFIAVKDLNLEIRSGETYGLVGPNGAGKTTTIKMLCGILKITRGEAYVFGERVPNQSVFHKIGYMPQDVALYMDLTVHEHMHFFGEVMNMQKKEIEQREKELLSFVKLEKWAGRKVGTLSSGMKRRLSLACSMIHDPLLFFLDEPTVGFDPQLRVSFWNLFKKLNEDGRTIIITTHYLDEANRCDRVGFMIDGILIAEGGPDEIKSKTHTTSLEDAFLSILGKEGS